MRRDRPGLGESAGWCSGRLVGSEGILPERIWTDSRDVQVGDGFVALPGGHSDGHAFIGESLARGARVIICRAEGEASWIGQAKASGASLLLVEDTEKALLAIAEKYLEEVKPRQQIAVTGSMGKTTTRELIRSALAGPLHVHAARRSHNTLIGCALTVLSMPPETEILVFEMGTNHPGEIAAIVEKFPPTIAVITAIAPVHLEGLGSLEGVLAAKLEIIPKNGLDLLIYNSDDERLSMALEKADFPFRMAGVGFGRGSTLLLTEATESMGGVLRVGLSYGGQSWVCESLLKGPHHAYNLGFAFMTGVAIGVSPEVILQGMTKVAPLKGRGMWFRDGRVHLVIDESYNANPSSVAAALEVISSLESPGKRWAVLGGMKELGERSGELHREILDKTGFLDGLVLVGEEWEPFLAEGHPGGIPMWWAEDAGSASELLEGLVGKRDTVLVKGSRFYGLERVVERLAGS
jgi:UDP-N-acetylmuramoyl-tripeptide--D-alanyl-D-alanine ligase